ncbi:unnamed protein product [Oikopleura dioica]|uniref:Peptidase S1 domain-containing protein n=2 Tax=Oikopleura dioica TaxID=34765 RepID=E4XG46_OIKDI|nr:unnamed protein product [Oikopleura dioica]
MSVPHVASVFYKGAYKCGASVLTSTSALTAAHCDYRKTGDAASTLKVRAGMQSTSSMINVQERATTTIRKHPSYSAASMKNDIMILKWSNQLTLNNYVKPVNLPSLRITRSSSSTASSFTTCAYGYDSNNRDTKELTCFTGSTKSHSTCNSSTGWNGLVYSPYQFCIEGNSKSAGACFHDGGAPAINNNVIYGIYSFPDLQFNGSTYPRSAKCNESGKPGVFTQEKGS